MNKATRNALIIALVCVAVGLLTALTAMLMIGFDFKGLSTVSYEEKTHKVQETFDSINIDDTEFDVRLVPCTGDECAVVCADSETVKHTVEVENSALTITRVDTRPWYQRIGIYWYENTQVTVYLPAGEYEDIYIKTVSGNITVPEDFAFGNAEVYSTSGNVSFCADTAEALTVKTVSGSIRIEGVAQGDVKVNSTSGEIALRDMTPDSLTVGVTSGDIELTDVVVRGNMKLETVSGDVEFNRADAQTMKLKTVSGDIEGTLLLTKDFVTDTVSGNIRVPRSDSTKGICEIKTTSGDVEIDLADQ